MEGFSENPAAQGFQIWSFVGFLRRYKVSAPCAIANLPSRVKEKFLDPMGLTSQQFAEAIHIYQEDVEAIINCRSSISKETALRLAAFFGTSPDFWINL